jgi:hypothetical protein
MCESEMFLFGNNHTNGTLHMRQTDYWATTEQFYTPFCSNTIKQNMFLHILHFLHFPNKNETDKNDKKYDRRWKVQDMLKTLNNAHAKFTSLLNIWQWINLLFFSNRTFLKKPKTFCHQNFQTM